MVGGVCGNLSEEEEESFVFHRGVSPTLCDMRRRGLWAGLRIGGLGSVCRKGQVQQQRDLRENDEAAVRLCSRISTAMSLEHAVGVEREGVSRQYCSCVEARKLQQRNGEWSGDLRHSVSGPKMKAKRWRRAGKGSAPADAPIQSSLQRAN